MEYNKIGIITIFLIFLATGCIVTNTMVTPEIVIAEKEQQQNSGIIIKDQGEFIDADGILNVVGVVDNNGVVPVSVIVGLNVSKDTSPNNKRFMLAGNPSSSSSSTVVTSASNTTLTSTLTE